MNTPADRHLTGDVLAGITSLFGGLTRAELREACTELLYKAEGERAPEAAIDAALERAIEEHRLHELDERGLLIPGPAAFPELPEFAEDLPVLLDIEEREVDRERAAVALVESLGEELEAGADPARQRTIAQLSYDIEAWANVDASALRGGAAEP